MNDPELGRKINQQLTILNNNLDILNNGNKAKLQSYGQDECSQIIDNFKKKITNEARNKSYEDSKQRSSTT